MATTETTKIDKLRDQVYIRACQAEMIYDAAQSENRAMTADEADRCNNLLTEANEIAADIEKFGGQPPAKLRDLQTELSKPCKFQNFDPSKVKKWGQAPPVDQWRNLRTGQMVRCLTRDQKLVDSLQPEDRGLSLGRAVCSMIRGDWRDAELEQRAMSTVNNVSAGFLVPDQLSANVIDLARAQSVVARLGAVTVPMETAELALARLTGDATFATKAENASFTASDLTFDRVNLISRTIGAVVEMSRELAEDSVNGPQIVQNALAAGLAAEIDRLALVGDGGTEPTGISNSLGINETAIGGALDYDDLLDGIKLIHDGNGQPNGIVTTTALATNLQKLKVNSEANHYSTAPPAVAAMPLLGSTKAESGEVYIADWTKGIIGLRGEARVEMTTEAGTSFTAHQLWVKIVWRGDFAITQPAHFTKLTGAT